MRARARARARAPDPPMRTRAMDGHGLFWVREAARGMGGSSTSRSAPESVRAGREGRRDAAAAECPEKAVCD